MMGTCKPVFLKSSIVKALKKYQKAIEIDPKDASSGHYLGSAYLAMKKHEDALAVFEEALRIHKENPFLSNGLALSRYNLKKSSKPVNIKRNFKL
jgi:tetratricopeptide (TPR) repeat protein